MSNKNYEQKALKILIDFKDKYLDKNFNNLEKFSFWELSEDKYFGNGLKYPDGDCTKVAYAIYYLLYSDKIEEYSTKYFADGLLYKYSGDTICTFNSLFGSETFRGRVFNLLNFTDTEKEKIINLKNNKYGDDFYHIYQRIGNFYLLPKFSIKINNKYYSLNTYRGCFQNDYFDIFINMLVDAISNPQNVDKNFLELINTNNFFFYNKDFNMFCELFDLPKEFKLSNNDCHYVHWILNNENSLSYKNFALDYVEKSKELIQNRSKIMLDKLLNKYPILNK